MGGTQRESPRTTEAHCPPPVPPPCLRPSELSIDPLINDLPCLARQMSLDDGTSPASKAFAARLAKYAFTSPQQSRSRSKVLSTPHSSAPTTADQASPLTPSRTTRSSARKTTVTHRRSDSLDSLDSDSPGPGPASAHRGGHETALTVAGPSTPGKRSIRPSFQDKRKGIDEAYDAPEASEDDELPSRPPSAKKAKKVPRPYADPEVYAHLQNTPDHLAVGLDSESACYRRWT